ncbi:uncharacterized protein [Dysidea avara]|uniref:uncharacterized protein isoform X2 n=1 Tax=Dysidea avara TaxID=196820 RepID=UPI003325232A
MVSGESSAETDSDQEQATAESSAVGPSAAHIAAMSKLETHRRGVQDLVQSLTSDEKDALLIALLRERGSVELAQSLLHREEQRGSSPGDPAPQIQNNPSWCKRGYCRETPTEQEHVCCKCRPCFTQQDGFYDIALNRHVLVVGILGHCDFYGDQRDFSEKAYRKAAYWQVIMYCHGYLGQGNRKVAPACAVWKIRDHYLAPDGDF